MSRKLNRLFLVICHTASRQVRISVTQADPERSFRLVTVRAEPKPPPDRQLTLPSCPASKYSGIPLGFLYTSERMAVIYHFIQRGDGYYCCCLSWWLRETTCKVHVIFIRFVLSAILLCMQGFLCYLHWQTNLAPCVNAVCLKSKVVLSPQFKTSHLSS